MGKKFKNALALVLSLTLAVGAFCMVPTANAWEKNIDTANWMRQLIEQKALIPGETPLNQVVWPSTHNSGTYNIRCNKEAIQEALKTSEIKESIDKVLPTSTILQTLVNAPIIQTLITTLQRVGGQCQDLSLWQQLEAGVRAFDFRFKIINDKYIVYHGDYKDLKGVFANCVAYNSKDDVNVDGSPLLSIDDALATINAFIGKHPAESVLFSMQIDKGMYDESPVDFDLDDSKKLFEIVKKIASKYNLTHIDNVGNSNNPINNFSTAYLPKEGKAFFSPGNDDTNTSYNVERLSVNEKELATQWENDAKKDGMTLFNGDKMVRTYNWPVKYKEKLIKESLKAISNMTEAEITASLTNSNDAVGIFKTSFTLALKCYGINNDCKDCSLLNPVITPKSQAQKLNKIIKNIESLNLNLGQPYGMLVMDYVTPELCKKVISLNMYEKSDGK